MQVCYTYTPMVNEWLWLHIYSCSDRYIDQALYNQSFVIVTKKPPRLRMAKKTFDVW